MIWIVLASVVVSVLSFILAICAMNVSDSAKLKLEKKSEELNSFKKDIPVLARAKYGVGDVLNDRECKEWTVKKVWVGWDHKPGYNLRRSGRPMDTYEDLTWEYNNVTPDPRPTLEESEDVLDRKGFRKL